LFLRLLRYVVVLALDEVYMLEEEEQHSQPTRHSEEEVEVQEGRDESDYSRSSIL
jgi:hypothetical protein